MSEPSIVPPHTRTIVELGMGDGRVLEALAASDPETVYIGIEIDKKLCQEAKARMHLQNAFVMEGSFADIVPSFPDESIDGFIAVLPDPAFIDEIREESWKPFYRQVHAKLKRPGAFRLVTEITDELLQPVSNDAFDRWSIWLTSAFRSIGFATADMKEGSPEGYSSRCLDQFRGDKERIRMLTADFAKS